MAFDESVHAEVPEPIAKWVPIDVLESIGKRLPLKTVLVMRRVCKHWSKMTLFEQVRAMPHYFIKKLSTACGEFRSEYAQIVSWLPPLEKTDYVETIKSEALQAVLDRQYILLAALLSREDYRTLLRDLGKEDEIPYLLDFAMRSNDPRLLEIVHRCEFPKEFLSHIGAKLLREAIIENAHESLRVLAEVYKFSNVSARKVPLDGYFRMRQITSAKVFHVLADYYRTTSRESVDADSVSVDANSFSGPRELFDGNGAQLISAAVLANAPDVLEVLAEKFGFGSETLCCCPREDQSGSPPQTLIARISKRIAAAIGRVGEMPSLSRHRELFYVAVKNDAPRVLEVLAEKYGFGPATLSRALRREMFDEAVKHARADVLRVLADKYGLGPADCANSSSWPELDSGIDQIADTLAVLADKYDAYCGACRNADARRGTIKRAVFENQPRLLSILADKYGCGPSDVPEGAQLVEKAVILENASLLGVLADKFGQGPATFPTPATRARVFATAMQSPSGPVLATLADKYGLGPADVDRSNESEVFLRIALRGEQNTLSVLVDKFGFGVDYVRTHNNLVFRTAAAGKDVAMIEFLAKKYKLTGADICPGAVSVAVEDEEVFAISHITPEDATTAHHGANAQELPIVCNLLADLYALCIKKLDQTGRIYRKLFAASQFSQHGFHFVENSLFRHASSLVAIAYDEHFAELIPMLPALGVIADDVRGHSAAARTAPVRSVAYRSHNGELGLFTTQFDFNIDDVYRNKDILREAAVSGNAEGLAAFQKAFGFSADDIRMSTAGEPDTLLCLAITLKRAKVVAVLRDCYGLTAEDVRALDTRKYILDKNVPEKKIGAVVAAATAGDAAMLVELHKFGLSADDARVNENYALCAAVGKGHVDALRVLRDCYGLTAEDVRALDTKPYILDKNAPEKRIGAVVAAATAGNAAMLVELHKFGLSADDARVNENHALRAAAGRGHVAALRVLRDYYGLTAADARACHRWACRSNSTATARNSLRALAEVFGLPAPT